jgi:hypothetical protein
MSEPSSPKPNRAAPGALPPGYLAERPLPSGIAGALGVGGYQLLVDIAGVGVGRLGNHVFLLIAPDPDPALIDPGTQISLHQSRLRDESEAAAFAQLAAELGYARLSGYRLIPVRSGVRSEIRVLNPATGSTPVTIPAKHPGRLFGGGTNVSQLLGAVRSLPAAGAPPDTQSPELLRQVLLALALRDDSLGGAEAAMLAERALALAQADRSLDPPAALAAAKAQGLPS